MSEQFLVEKLLELVREEFASVVRVQRADDALGRVGATAEMSVEVGNERADLGESLALLPKEVDELVP